MWNQEVSRETLDRLSVFVDLTIRWNARFNLLAPNETAHIWRRHVGDSLQLVPLIPAKVSSAADLGSGAGFPGLILSIATGLPFLLVESDKRKAAFLQEAIRVTGASATVLAQRAERLVCRVDLVTARALAPLPRLLAWAYPRLLPGGACLFPKGRNAAAELAEAEAHWNMTCQRVPSVTAPGAYILVVAALAPK